MLEQQDQVAPGAEGPEAKPTDLGLEMRNGNTTEETGTWEEETV